MKHKIISLLKNLQQFIQIKNSGLFDIPYYLNAYSENLGKKVNPIWHYITNGWKEGKNPSPDFDTVFYLRENKDIRKAKLNPLTHFIQFGQAEGRSPNPAMSTDPYSYLSWIDQYGTLTPHDRALIEAQIREYPSQPLISILLPVRDANEQFLTEVLESLHKQIYIKWECCIVDNASDPNIRTILEDFSGLDSRFKIVYHDSRGPISASLNSALSTADGEYIGLLGQGDIISEHALYFVVNEIINHPHVEMIYSDEDLIDEFSVRYDPYFKPDWNPDLFCGHNLLAHFLVINTDRVRQTGGFRDTCEGAHDWDLALRISEKIPSSHIRHIPYILYHWRAIIGSVTPQHNTVTYTKTAQYKALATHYSRINHPVTITLIDDEFWKIDHIIEEPKPLTSIIIPTKNQVRHLKDCIESIRNRTYYSNYEIIVINNQSDDQHTLEYLRETNEEGLISLLDYDHTFNYSAINNFAVPKAKGDVLVFMNNDIEVISPDWLEVMVGNAVRPDIGAVGAMLYYPNDTIQHAGIILGLREVAGHIYYGSPRGTLGQRGRVQLAQNFTAVTGACLAITKNKLIEVGGFNEKQLGIAYNDIDLCIRLMKAGYRNVWTPHAELYHFESLSREYEDTPEKYSRFKLEAEYLKNQWSEILMNDPTYNPNLSLAKPDFSLAFPPRTRNPWLQD